MHVLRVSSMKQLFKSLEGLTSMHMCSGLSCLQGTGSCVLLVAAVACEFWHEVMDISPQKPRKRKNLDIAGEQVMDFLKELRNDRGRKSWSFLKILGMQHENLIDSGEQF